jgi:hypothetical protein
LAAVRLKMSTFRRVSQLVKPLAVPDPSRSIWRMVSAPAWTSRRKPVANGLALGSVTYELVASQ